MKRWAHVAGAVGTISVLASCSGAQPPGEGTSSLSQADTPGVTPSTVQAQYSARVCQLIGDYDFTAAPGTLPTKNRTDFNFGVRGTDEGSAIFDADDGKIFFYFGDTSPDGNGYDVVGWTTDLRLPDDGCPSLTFGGFYSDEQDEQGAPIVTIDGERQGINQAPNGGFYSPIEKRIYLFYNIFRENGEPQNRTVLTWADPAAPNLLHSVNSSPFNGPSGMTANDQPSGISQFLMVAPLIVRASDVPTIPFGANVNPQSQVLLIYGATGPFHLGTMQLAAVPLDQVANSAAYLYQMDAATQTGTAHWTGDHKLAGSIFTDTPPCDGEVTAEALAPGGPYVIAYVCGGPQMTPPISTFHGGNSQGIFARYASSPIGNWSTAAVLFDSIRDGAIGYYVHDQNPRATFQNGRLSRTPGDLCVLDTTFCGGDSPTPETNRSCIASNTVPPYPSCSFPSAEDSDPTNALGCCTDSSHCCDFAFTSTESNGQNTPFGSASPGRIYNPYFISPYTRTTATLQGTTIPSGLQITYNVSTWNPYVVDVITSTISLDDADGDTVPDEIDNCPLVSNPGQENCNLEAEQAWNVNSSANVAVKLLGDVCDPVPCPRANTNTPTSTGTTHCIPARRDPSIPQVCFEEEIHDKIDLTPVGSYALSGTASATNLPIEHPVNSVSTHGRFCEKVPTIVVNGVLRQQSVTCTDPQFQADSQLDLSLPAEMEIFDRAHPWHRITLENPNPLINEISDRNEERLFSFNYGGATSGGAMRWDYTGDNIFWQHDGPGGVIGIPDSTCTGTQPCHLNGRLWLHGDTNVGQVRDTPPSDGAVVGFHGGGPDGSIDGPKSLTNYYFDSEPDFFSVDVIPGVGELPRGYRFAFRSPGDPLEDDRATPDWQRYERGDAVPIFLAGQSLLGLRQTSALVDASSSFGASFARELRGALPWAGAPGPTSVASSVPMAVEISADGTSVLGTANLSGGQVLLGRPLELIAQPGTDAIEEIGALASVMIPSSLSVLEGNAGNGTATLSFQAKGSVIVDNATTAKTAVAALIPTVTINCTYAGGASTSHPTMPQDRALGQHYNFVSCDNGAAAGATLQIVGSQLHIVSGDALSGTTQVEGALNALEVSGSELPNRSTTHRGCARATGPRPRHGFVATYAPSLNGVFVVGGKSRWDESLSDAWFKPLDGPWQEISLPSGTLEHVIDAAYSPADGRLWVLDQAESTARDVGRWSCHHQRTLRLLRIERVRSSVSVVASATPDGRFDSRGLLTDKDGQILLYASSDRSRTHRVVRLVPDANAFDAFATRDLPNPLSGPPVVDFGGYSFIEPAPRNSPHALAMDRAPSLAFSPASLSSWTALLQ